MSKVKIISPCGHEKCPDCHMCYTPLGHVVCDKKSRKEGSTMSNDANSDLNNKTLPEILDDALGEATDNWERGYPYDWIERYKQAIAKELMGIIGEDDDPETYFSGNRQWEVPEPEEARIRNELKATQRARLTAFIGYKEK